MRRYIATLSFSVILMGICVADEPVARVQSIKPADNTGQAVLTQKRPADAKGYRVSVNSTGYIKDHFITDKNTIAALEFLIGGRVGINKDTDIEIVNERSVADGKTDVKRIILKNGSLWVKADAKALKQPIEIQTNGGVMGIKGTEFTVDQQPDGSTRVCCFESNSDQGGVEVRDSAGKVVGIAKPGDEYRVSLKNAPVVKHNDDVPKFRESILNDDVYRGMSTATYFIHAFGGSTYIPYVGNVFYAASIYDNLERNPGYAAAQILSAANVPYAGTIGGFLSSAPRQPAKPDFPSELSPDGSDKSTKPKQSNPFPSFSWVGVEDAKGYVVMVSQDENCDKVVFTERVTGTSVNYPPDMRPLDPGQYYWRVIPVDEEDKPVEKGAQTFFTVVK
ncbi:FecR domain-containing protein [bacterium]|nr:FecR domain-containing protein [bacterium]